MTSIDQQFANIKPYDGHEQITAANGDHLSITGIESMGVTTPQNHSLTLSNVYPKLSANLLSVEQLVDNGRFTTFSSYGCTIQDQRRRR